MWRESEAAEFYLDIMSERCIRCGEVPNPDGSCACKQTGRIKLNTWCRGILLPDDTSTGCACDCPTCKAVALESRELLGQLIDLAIVRRNDGWHCAYCKDIARLPDQVKHTHNCVVARAKEYLWKYGPA